MTFGGPADGRTKVRSIEYTPGMAKPDCTCMVRSQQIFDPSGNLWDGDESLTYEMLKAGWSWKPVMVPKYEAFDHNMACPISKWHPPFFVPPVKTGRTHVGNGAYKGPFAFTFTMSPEWGLTRYDMIEAAQKLMSQKSQPVIKFAWYLEYGNEEQQQHPHIHGMYETGNGRRIEMKHFKRAWANWSEDDKRGQGFVGGYHRPVKDGENYAKYIKKQGGIGESSDNL